MPKYATTVLQLFTQKSIYLKSSEWTSSKKAPSPVACPNLQTNHRDKLKTKKVHPCGFNGLSPKLSTYPKSGKQKQRMDKF